jgi:predicted amidohydrolase
MSADELVVAVVQLNASEDKQANLDRAEALVVAAAAAGAQVVALPEFFTYLGPDDRYGDVAEPVPGPTTERCMRIAREQSIHLLAGSIPERDDDSGALFNTSVLIDINGRIAAKYRKIHLFDVVIGDVSEQESRFLTPGDEVVTGEIDGHRVGLSVCYDLRFPELYRRLAVRGAELLFVPAAFTTFTGKDHWEILVRARAIENQCFVVAADQTGPHAGGSSFGRSMIVDPWGIPLAIAPDGDAFALARLQFGQLREIRERLPALANRRLSVGEALAELAGAVDR